MKGKHTSGGRLRTPSLPTHGKEGAHPSHAKMNKMHGTPQGMGPPTGMQGGQYEAPPAGMVQDSDQQRGNGSMTEGC